MSTSATAAAQSRHRRLERQLQRIFGVDFIPTGAWTTFLQAVDGAYRAADRRIGLLGRTLERVEEHMRIAAVAFQSRDGMLVTDAEGVILQVNKAFTEVTGYSAQEAIGKTPALLHSGRQDAAFYRDMWGTITREGHWQGEIWNRRKDGGIYAEWLSISCVKNKAGEITHYLGVFSDISSPKEAERKILELAFYDPLTTLPNRRLLLDRLQQAMMASARSDRFGAVLLLDLDHFKTLNDTHGHDAGDELLVETARRLRETLRESDSAARLGGDEFVVLLEGLHEDALTAGNLAETIAGKLRTVIGQPASLKCGDYQVTPSIGVTLFRAPSESVEELLKQADLALYQSKGAGRNAIRFYNPAMQAAIDARAGIEAKLRRALAGDELLLFYQPQVSADGVLIGAEARLRWLPPGAGTPQLAATFLSVAEESGLIVSIDGWVLRAACRQLAAWADQPATRQLRLAINVSPRQFRQPDFVGQVDAALKHSGASPARLRLELTESLLADDPERAVRNMQALKKLGVNFSIDDFGTGYSSLARLKHLPIDQIKIDRSFVRALLDDADDRAIVRAIISLGNSLGFQVIAEGVENEAQRDILAAQGCHAYQGHLFGPPGSAAEIERLARAALDRRAGSLAPAS